LDGALTLQVHSDGYFQIKDRSKDIVISGGENISSIEVENVLCKHPVGVSRRVCACVCMWGGGWGGVLEVSGWTQLLFGFNPNVYAQQSSTTPCCSLVRVCADHGLFSPISPVQHDACCHLQAVASAAVVARPSNKWGETPCAFVTLKTAATDGEDQTRPPLPPPTAAELIKHAKGFLDFKAPKTIIFVDELPVSSLGKVLKVGLREQARAMGSSD
jgi:acyl-CoA synthetase (AMP-forming)/AMP-acid ligase II